MSSIVMLIAAFVSLTRSASAAANPNICSGVPTSNSILQLQNGQRCLWISSTIQTSWNASMTFCQTYNSYLAHIYSSDDYTKISAWKTASSISAQYARIGMKSFMSGTSLAFPPPRDGSQCNWMYTTSTTMPFTMNNQYIGFMGSTWAAWGISNYLSLNLQFTITDNYAQITPSPSNGGIIQNNGNAYPICEQSTTFMNSQFTATAGKQSPAYVTQSLTAQNIRQCSKQCAHTEYCMGFNVLNAAAGSISTQTSLNCNMLSVRLADGSLTLNNAASNVYYERSTSAPPP